MFGSLILFFLLKKNLYYAVLLRIHFYFNMHTFLGKIVLAKTCLCKYIVFFHVCICGIFFISNVSSTNFLLFGIGRFQEDGHRVSLLTYTFYMKLLIKQPSLHKVFYQCIRMTDATCVHLLGLKQIFVCKYVTWYSKLP